MASSDGTFYRYASIRVKLALLGGIPVLGAALLAFQMLQGVQEETRKAEAIGSIENLSALSVRMTDLLRRLQYERAELALEQGRKANLVTGPSAARQDRVVKAIEATAQSEVQLKEFLSERDVSRMPIRISAALDDARRKMRELYALRERLEKEGVPIDEVLDAYASTDATLIRALASLTDLSSDGELMRIIGALVILLEFQERVSQEHALLAYVAARGEFPPGSYRRFVQLSSEQDIYSQVFMTSAALDAQEGLQQARKSEAWTKAHELRTTALEATEDELDLNPERWFDTQVGKLDQLANIQLKLERQTAEVALAKVQHIRQTTSFSLGLAATVIVVTAFMGWLIARRISWRLELLRDASARVASGDMEAKVVVSSHDELGQLGATFNDMVSELSLARSVMAEQLRMAQELELAASIQRAMLPPQPKHKHFEFAGKMRPADEVGGDFYDVLTQQDSDALWITIGDVSGHGVGAGLIMLMAQSAFASHFLTDPHAAPQAVLMKVNALLCENIAKRLKDNKYLTAQLLQLTGPDEFACVGGHEWPVVYRAATGRCEIVETPGPWLGIIDPLSDVPTTTIRLAPGDVLCLYSDGLTEARNASSELFDLDRFKTALENALTNSATLKEAANAVFETGDAFAVDQDDDWTLLLVRRAAEA